MTPSFNQAEFLEETMLSVLDQDYPNLEYIVIDGGSKDGSVEIIKKYANRLAYWVSEPDNGQSDAINKGFERATGDILAWLNSDDAYYPGTLSYIANYFKENPADDLVYGIHNDVNERGEVIRKSVWFPFAARTFQVGFAICQPTAFWRRKVWDTCGPLDTQLHYCMDYDFFSKTLKSGFRIRSIRHLMCRFRYHETSKGVTRKPLFLKETKQLFEKHFPGQHKTPVRAFISRCEYFSLVGIRRVLRSFR